MLRIILQLLQMSLSTILTMFQNPLIWKAILIGNHFDMKIAHLMKNWCRKNELSKKKVKGVIYNA